MYIDIIYQYNGRRFRINCQQQVEESGHLYCVVFVSLNSCRKPFVGETEKMVIMACRAPTCWNVHSSNGSSWFQWIQSSKSCSPGKVNSKAKTHSTNSLIWFWCHPDFLSNLMQHFHGDQATNQYLAKVLSHTYFWPDQTQVRVQLRRHELRMLLHKPTECPLNSSSALVVWTPPQERDMTPVVCHLLMSLSRSSLDAKSRCHHRIILSYSVIRSFSKQKLRAYRWAIIVTIHFDSIILWPN